MPGSQTIEPFLSRAEMESVQGMSAPQLDGLPFGAIQLDRDGTIVAYNRYEADLTGRDPKNVMGRNFFTEVAPCTNVQRFAGKFREDVAKGELHETFPYYFDFKMKPRNVNVTLFYSQITGQAWVFIRDVTPSGDAMSV